MHTSMFAYIVSALNILHHHVEGISIVDTPLPVQRNLFESVPKGYVSKDVTHTKQVPNLEAAHIGSVGNGQKRVEPAQFKEGSIFTLGSADCLENMMRAHTQLYSNSKSEVQQALKAIRLQLFDELGADRKWRSGGGTVIMNLKALELSLLKIEAQQRVNQSLTQLENYLLENIMKLIYELRSFSKIPAERIWFNCHIKQFFKGSNSMFLRDEYSKAVRRAQLPINRTPIGMTEYDETGRAIRIAAGPHMPSWLSEILTSPSRIEESEVVQRNMPQDIVDFVRLFNSRDGGTSISDFEPIVERLSQAVENPPSKKLDPQVNSLRVELIALAAQSFALKNTEKVDEEWVFPYFIHLMRLTKLASEPEDRIHAEGLVNFSQLAVPALRSQFIQEYPAALKEIIEKDFKYGGISLVFDRVLSNGPDKELRQTALELRGVFERMQNFQLNGNVAPPRVVNLRLGMISGNPLNFLKKGKFHPFFQEIGGKWTNEIPMINKAQPTLELAGSSTADQLVEKEVENWIRLTTDLKKNFLLSSGASAYSKMIAEEVLFAGGILAFKKFKTLPISKRGFESIYKTSLTTLKNLANDHISPSSQSPKKTLLGSLAIRFSSLIKNTSNETKFNSKFL
ncbi:hypothetical protein PtA15_9A195 [Puccinia triticina]|uniref:Uncharacterized protein n=1 Tax=Puccinia triticina TaxID=208348 RepID=A0ABY7CWC7_9BASI|nr:uncharacterized protein PtA15_9A195 [Puccinia triticina]WAQ88070.1 hypothetical protein PtA15_9A195 [Puccinia triticina]